MPGPAPKAAGVRQRRNRSSTAAALDGQESPKKRAPGLPKRVDQEGNEKAWHPMTLSWWKDVWRSPMAAEFLQADIHGLFVLADLVDAYWHEPTISLATEIRLQRQCFGLTPIDRRRLQWEMGKPKEREHRGAPSAPAQANRKPPTPFDPRQVLHAV